MGLLDRLWRLIRANLSSLINHAEDPEKILEQAVVDMQDDLVQLRQAVAQAIATQKRTERQYNQAQSTANEWYRKAELALQKGEEGLAREALTRRKSYQDMATAMKAQIEQQSLVVTKLKKDMVSLEGKIAEARTKKDLYIARARSAQASERLNAMLNQVDPSSTLQAFNRMEEKVLQLEARSEALGELGRDDLSKRFAALEAGDDVEQELAALKGQLLPSPGSTAGQLPASSTKVATDPAIEAELDQLRSQIEGS